MNVNPNNFLSVKEVLADVLVGIDDVDNRKLTLGFVRQQVKYALDELGFDVFFLKHTVDYPLPDDLKLEMPAGVYNMEQINIYTGSPDNVGYVENVYWKRGMITRGKDQGYTARSMQYNISDPFVKNTGVGNGRYFFNVQNGMIMLSDSCATYDYIRLTFSGIPSGNLDDMKMIPPEARKAIAMWAIEKCASYLKVSDQKYRVVQIDAASQLDEYGFNGAWHQARQRMMNLDKKQREDLREYWHKMYF